MMARLSIVFAVLPIVLGACSAQQPATPTAQVGQTSGPPAIATSAAVAQAPATADAATRTAPVVPGRPGRVFIFAGVGDNCEQLGAPEVTISQPPQQGEISFRPGQETTIAASQSGKCLGTKARGTGVYYTARAGAAGTDSFALSARMPTGETMTRTFAVSIAP